jgi:hypothetical protein
MLKLPSALWLGVLLSAGCFRASPPGWGSAGAGSAVVKSDAGQVCVENQLCIRGSHWDTQLCKCVPDEVAGSTAAAGGGAPVCVETALCVRDAHWDSVLCRCVLDSPDAGAGETCGASTCATAEHCCQVASAVDGTCIPQCSRVCRAQPCKAPNDAGAAQRCQSASDCSGPTPHLCASCVNANGGPQGSACAHWICSEGSCQIGICE